MCQNRAMEALENENISLCEEVMRLKHVLYCYSLQYGTATDQSKKVQEIKSEAYKEFADKLTDKIADAMDRSHDNPNGSNYDLTDVFDSIDEVKKEMTEVKDDD